MTISRMGKDARGGVWTVALMAGVLAALALAACTPDETMTCATPVGRPSASGCGLPPALVPTSWPNKTPTALSTATPTPRPPVPCGDPDAGAIPAPPLEGCRNPALGTPPPTPPAPPLRVYPIQACALLSRADAEQALHALGSRAPAITDSRDRGGPHAPRSTCAFHAAGGVVTVTINHGGARAAFEQEIRRLAALPDTGVMGQPVLLGVGRTYSGFLVYPKATPAEGTLYVLFDGGYLEVKAAVSGGAPSMSTLMPVLDRLAQQALTSGRFQP